MMGFRRRAGAQRQDPHHSDRRPRGGRGYVAPPRRRCYIVRPALAARRHRRRIGAASTPHRRRLADLLEPCMENLFAFLGGIVAFAAIAYLIVRPKGK
jgi:hypothetical protein